MKEKIKSYWNDRARDHSDSCVATTNDIHLRNLEIETIIKTFEDIGINKGASILDVGCGDGYSTIKIAQAYPDVRFHGIDYCENMIMNANRRLEAHPDMKTRVKFSAGDVTDLEKSLGGSSFDVVLTDRCLINLESSDIQLHAIAQIAEHTKSNGYYIAIENFIEYHNIMNEARRSVGLPDIPVRWHNLYFQEYIFTQESKKYFKEIAFKNFSSSYYFATRIIYSAMCQMQGKTPDYNHEIHQLAGKLPWTGEFSPVMMAILHKE